MQYEAEINGRLRRIAVKRAEGRFVVDVDGRSWAVDAVRIGANRLSLLVSEPTARESGFGRGFSRTLSYDVTVTPGPGPAPLQVRVGSISIPVLLNGHRRFGRKDEGAQAAAGPQRVVAPMPGKVVRVLVKRGDAVRARQPLAVIEAMKMENELRAASDGVVAELPVSSGQLLDAGALIAVITR